MNGLDSFVEALAYNYLSYGLLTVVNNVWTWVAVITAAVSFLTIKASSPPPRGKTPDGLSLPAEITEPVETTSSSSSSSKTTAFGGVEREGSTKGKLILYYNYDNDDDEKWGLNKGEDNREVNGKWAVAVEERWWDRWEKLMRMRMGGDEWCRYQDLTVINGSVVKFWDVHHSRKEMVVNGRVEYNILYDEVKIMAS